MPDIKNFQVNGTLYDLKDAVARVAIGDMTALGTEAKDDLVAAINELLAKLSGVGGITFIKSTDTANPVVLRDLASGTYVLYGRYIPYTGSTRNLTFSSNLLVNIIKSSSMSHVQVFYPANNVVQFLNITDSTYERTDIKLNDLNTTVATLDTSVGTLSDLATTEKSSLVAAINEVAANTGSGGGLTSAQIAALDGMFKVCAFTKDDVSAEYNAFMAAFGIEDVHTHSYTSSVTTAATCTTAGVRTYSCACGESYTESIPATGHNYVDGVCTVCGAADPDYEPDVTLTSISATYSGGDVPVGTAVNDLTGIVVNAHYSDGRTEPVTGYTLSGTIAEGNNTITVSYGGKTATITVVGIAEEEEVEIFEPEAPVTTSVALDQANTLVNVSTGVTSTNADWVASDYVAIPTDSDYIVFRTEKSATIRYAFYDSEKAYISGEALTGVTNKAIELPANAAFVRMCNNNVITTVTVTTGKSMITSWGNTTNNYLKSDGTITEGYTGTIQQRISNGYIKIPDGVTALFRFNRTGYSFRYGNIAVYDENFAFVEFSELDGLNTTSQHFALSNPTNSVYFKAGIWDAGNDANNNPAEQVIFGCY